MPLFRTDMADERRSALSAHEIDSVPGLSFSQYTEKGVKITEISADTPRAAEAIGKPQGQYIAMDLAKKWQNDNDLVIDMAHLLASKLTGLLPEEGSVLAVGLGNRYITADALGPLAAEKIIVTRHLRQHMPKIFSSLREVCCIAPGVMGQTGMEVIEVVKGAVEHIQPSAVIAIDALAAMGLERLGNSFQLSTGGIAPGEGAGNRRLELSRQTLGVPVISIGVPTVADAEALAFKNQTGGEKYQGFLITPGDIDMLTARAAKAIGYGINLALQGDMPISDMEQLLA